MIQWDLMVIIYIIFNDDISIIITMYHHLNDDSMAHFDAWFNGDSMGGPLASGDSMGF